MISWRPLLDALRIPWRDRGANCSQGHCNVQCPWCGKDDPSYHLGIEEATGYYYCFRNPAHAGKSIYRLLHALGVESHRIDALIKEFSSGDDSPLRIAPKPAASPIHWERYNLASTIPAALEYLASREITRADIARFDLRIARNGRFANRILFPLTAYNKIEGFTGRAIYDFMQPRYLSEFVDPGVLYIPRLSGSDNIILCEGPFDALKVAMADSYKHLFPIAILGHAMPDERIRHIAWLAQGCKKILFAFDDDYSYADQYRLIGELRHPSIPIPQRVNLPDSVNDLGEVPLEELSQWVSHLPLNG